MGAALKKGVDYTQLSYLRWVAFGVVDIEKLERMQRRNYINHMREELKLHGLELHCHGTSYRPVYAIEAVDGSFKTQSNKRRWAPLPRIATIALQRIDPTAQPEEHNG